jgi:hypothetical protein
MLLATSFTPSHCDSDVVYSIPRQEVTGSAFDHIREILKMGYSGCQRENLTHIKEVEISI